MLKNTKNLTYYLISLLFSMSILFYGNFQFRAVFTWLPSMFIILISILFLFSKMKVDKVFLKIVLINSVWLIYALFFSFSVLNFEIHIKAILETLLYILIFSIVITYIGKDIYRLFKMILLSLNIFLLVAIVVFLLKVTGVYDNGHTFASLYSNRNTFAFMALVYLAIVVNLPKYIVYNFKTIAITLLLFLIFVTGSSKGVLGILIIYSFYFLSKYSFKKIVFIIPIFFFLAYGSLFVFDTTYKRLEKKIDAIVYFDNNYKADNIGHDSGKIRLFLAMDAINIFLEHKLSGVGVNNGQFYLPLPQAYKKVMVTINSQNNVTEMLLNVGLPGFLMFYIPLLYLLYKSIKIHSNDNEIKTMVMTLIILKIFMDIGMKSYNDAGHVFLVIFSWILYLKYLKKGIYK